MKTVTEIESQSAEQTQALGADIGRSAQPGDVLLLLGEFGVGKTTLVQGIARGLGIEGPVTSPSFVIANEHQGRIPLYHVDLYRLETMDFATLEALAEYFGGDGLCVVEWPAALPDDLVDTAMRIELEVTGEQTRHLHILSGEARLGPIFERNLHPAKTGRS